MEIIRGLSIGTLVRLMGGQTLSADDRQLFIRSDRGNPPPETKNASHSGSSE